MILPSSEAVSEVKSGAEEREADTAAWQRAEAQRMGALAEAVEEMKRKLQEVERAANEGSEHAVLASASVAQLRDEVAAERQRSEEMSGEAELRRWEEEQRAAKAEGDLASLRDQQSALSKALEKAEEERAAAAATMLKTLQADVRSLVERLEVVVREEQAAVRGEMVQAVKKVEGEVKEMGKRVASGQEEGKKGIEEWGYGRCRIFDKALVCTLAVVSSLLYAECAEACMNVRTASISFSHSPLS